MPNFPVAQQNTGLLGLFMFTNAQYWPNQIFSEIS